MAPNLPAASRTVAEQTYDTLKGDLLSGAFAPGSALLTREERRALQRQHNGPSGEAGVAGPVLSGYRIPVVLRAVAPDGKTPIELGPFERAVVITSPSLPHGESKTVFVRGRVRGVVV